MKACDICGAENFTTSVERVSIDFELTDSRLVLDLCEEHRTSLGFVINRWANQQFVSDFLEIEGVIGK